MIEAGESMTKNPAAGVDPADGRYVNLENAPLSGEQLRGTTGDVGTEQSTLAVAKRMPVQMRLLINQVELNRLLIECGNSPLTVEVQQLQFNPTAEGTRPRAEAPSPAQGPVNSTGLGLKERHYRTIELFGIISMYNPVNSSALGIEEPAKEEAGGPAADASGTGQTDSPAAEAAAESTAPPTDNAAAAAAAPEPAAETATPPAAEPGGVTP